MPYNFVADSFHTKKNFVADQAKCDFTPKTAVLRFLARGLRATYDDHLIGSLESEYSGLPISIS